MKAVCGYSQMQVLNASTVLLISPLVFRYVLFLSVPNLVCSFPPCFVPSAFPLSFPVLSFRSLFLPLPFRPMFVSASLKDHALLGSYLWGRAGVCCCGASLNHLLRAQAAELQPSAHYRSPARLAPDTNAPTCFVALTTTPDNVQGN